MRFPPIPGPRDLIAVAERAGDLVEQLLAAVPRVTAILDQAESLLTDAADIVAGIGETRASADAAIDRITVLLDGLEPSLRTLQPTLERLAETTDPREVDALVSLVDRLPLLAEQVERDVVPIMRTLGSVAPDLHELLEVSRELNEMLAKVPGLNRLRRP